jgi:hypothetical protein
VTALGRPVKGAAISDGLSVVATDADGRYQLLGDSRRPHLSLTPPSGYAIPTGRSGTARLYQPLTPDARDEATALSLPDSAGTTPMSVTDSSSWPIRRLRTTTRWGVSRKETVPDVQATVKKALGELPLFGVADGDIMYDNLALYDGYEAAVGRMGVPFFQVVGNHDLDLDAPPTRTPPPPSPGGSARATTPSIAAGSTTWCSTMSSTTRAATSATCRRSRLAWLAADLALVPRGSTVVVFLHIPLESSLTSATESGVPTSPTRDQSRRAAGIVGGPTGPTSSRVITHECEHRTHGKVVEHTLGAACGAWWDRRHLL